MGGGPAKDQLVIILPFPPPQAILEHLRNKFPKIDITFHEHDSFSPNPADSTYPPEIFKDATILSTFSNLPKRVEDAPNLQLLHLFSAGSNHISNTPLYKDSDVVVTTSSGIHGPQIAEWVLMTHLVATHKYNWLHDLQKEHKWGSHPAYGEVRDRVGLRVGILGYGSIGRQVGRLAKAMGMEVVAFTASSKNTPEKKKDNGFIVPGTGDPDGEFPVEWYSGLDKPSLQHFLKQNLDWIVVSVPLTDETKGFLSKDEFRILAENAKNTKPFITNIARGPIIDQPALIEALKDGTLGGAALDVTDPEPLPEDSELWSLENVVLTPHISGVGVSYVERAFKVLEMNLERREKGEKLINVVDRSRGY